jgi:hypothetical protein
MGGALASHTPGGKVYAGADQGPPLLAAPSRKPPARMSGAAAGVMDVEESPLRPVAVFRRAL